MALMHARNRLPIKCREQKCEKEIKNNDEKDVCLNDNNKSLNNDCDAS